MYACIVPIRSCHTGQMQDAGIQSRRHLSTAELTFIKVTSVVLCERGVVKKCCLDETGGAS